MFMSIKIVSYPEVTRSEHCSPSSCIYVFILSLFQCHLSLKREVHAIDASLGMSDVMLDQIFFLFLMAWYSVGLVFAESPTRYIIEHFELRNNLSFKIVWFNFEIEKKLLRCPTIPWEHGYRLTSQQVDLTSRRCSYTTKGHKYGRSGC